MTRRALWLEAVLAAGLALSALSPSFAVGDTKVEAGQCGITTGGSAIGNTVICEFRMPPEQLKATIEAAVKGGLIDGIVDVSKKLGVTENAAKNLLKVVGEDPNIPDDKLPEALTEAVIDLKRAQAQAAALNPADPTAQKLIEEARSEIDGGNLDKGPELLRRATQAQIAAAREVGKLKEQPQADEDAQMLGAASSIAVEGDIALTKRRYLQAAELFGQAAADVPSGHTAERGSYTMRQADALYRQGDQRGDNAALNGSISAYGVALAEYPRAEFPLDWAQTQTNLGNALQKLGSRESGTAHLENAVAAYREALQVVTRELAPLQWASTQTNLGAALEALGERESGTARLEEAVAAYREALEEYTRDRAPLEWATVQDNLGNALGALGERENGTARLDEAVATYRAALEELTRERDPLVWARTQNGLGNVLLQLGSREGGTARFAEAAAAFRATLQELTRDRASLEWATVQNNLGNALVSLGERQIGAAHLEEAVAAYRAALEERTRERVPFGWAATQSNLGSALTLLGERESGTARLAEAVPAFRAALQERTRERVPIDWAKSFGGQGVAMMLIADRTNNDAVAQAASQQIQAADETARSGGDEPLAAYFEAQLIRAKAIRDRLKGR